MFTATVPLALICLAVPIGEAMAADAIPYEGEWTLTYESSTPPGGFALPGFVIRKSFRARARFVVDEDGRFFWETSGEDGEQPEFRTEQVHGAKITEHRAGFLRGRGAVDKEHGLELVLEWGVKEGFLNSLSPTHIELRSQTVSADGTQVTDTGKTYCFTCVVQGWQPSTFAYPVQPTAQSQWRLAPVSREVEQIGEDVEKETVVYQASQPTAFVGFNESERIEVIHIRYGEIVPRAVD